MNRKLLKSEKAEKDILLKVKTVDTKENTVEGVFSAEVEDRQGEIVVQSGWILDNYKKNPIVLWAHNSGQPPIARMLEIGVNPATNQLEGKMQFAVNESPFAAEVFALIVGGYQKAFSAGFINNKYEIDQENDKVYLLENELLEMSVVPVPANQLALAKSKGMIVTAYKKEIGDEDEEIPEDVDDLEDLDLDDISESKALEKISKSNNETISQAISTLTGVLKARSEADKPKGEVSDVKVEHPVKTGGQNQVPVSLLNKAIRELLGVKHSYKN